MCWITKGNTKTQGVDKVPPPEICIGEPTATLIADVTAIFEQDIELSVERRALIERALASVDRRKNEDVAAWAKRLANDVKDAND